MGLRMNKCSIQREIYIYRYNTLHFVTIHIASFTIGKRDRTDHRKHSRRYVVIVCIFFLPVSFAPYLVNSVCVVCFNFRVRFFFLVCLHSFIHLNAECMLYALYESVEKGIENGIQMIEIRYFTF